MVSVGTEVSRHFKYHCLIGVAYVNGLSLSQSVFNENGT